MARKRLNTAWLHTHINDPYVKRAQQEGYRTRAAYKLQEIDERDKLIRAGQRIVDLGAAPGSWSQYVRHKLARKTGAGIDGEIFALDILPMAPIADVQFIQGDFREEAVLAQLSAAIKNQPIDLVLSDMAPNLSGITAVDAVRISHVCDLALEFAQRFLKPNGALLVKSFHGSGFSQIVERFKHSFREVVTRKPKASRDKSAEIFILGKFIKAIKMPRI